MTIKVDGTNGVLQAYDYQVLTTGFSYTFAAGTQTLIINPAGTLATGTITMPAAPVDGMTITFISTQQITALTVNGNTGQTVVSKPVALNANQAVSYIYRLSSTTWYPYTTQASQATGPSFSAYYSSSQNPGSGVWTKVPCDTEEFDTNSCYDNATNYRFTPNVAGYYQISGAASMTDVSNSSLTVSIYKNGSSFKSSQNGASGSQTSIVAVSALVYFNGSTDYVEFYCNISGSATRTLTGGAALTYFQGAMVRSA